jgi:branched-chain amino acid transport system substrate-binding protein
MHRSLTRPTIIAVLAVTSLVTAACTSSGGTTSAASSGSADASSVKCPVTVAAIGPLTGASATFGNTEKVGYDLAVNALNSSSKKVLGCKVQITYVDMASNPSNIPGLLTKAYGSNYDYVTQYAQGTDVAVPFFATQNKLSIGSDGQEEFNNPSKYPLWFDMSPSIDQPIQLLGKDLAAAGYKRIALVQSSIGNFGGNDAVDLSNALAGTGTHLVVTQSVPLTIVDATGVAIKVKDAHPDAVIADLYGPALGVVLKALTSAGVTVPRFGGYYAAAGPPSAFAPASEIKDMVIMTYKASVAGAIPGMDAFAAEVAAAVPGHKLTAPITAASFGYDALMAWAAAANATKGFDSQKLADWLAANGHTTIANLISFDPKVTGFSASNRLAIGQYELAQANSMNADGEFTAATITPKG